LEDAEQVVIKYFSTVPSDELSSKIAFTFKRFDADQDGFLTRQDLARAFAFMGKRVSEEEIEALMDIYDANKDDLIDSGEFEHMMRVKLKLPCKPDCKQCKKLFASPSSRPGTSDSLRSPTVLCKYECGYSGTVRQVAEHECTCALATSPSTSSPGSAVPPSNAGGLPPISRTASSPVAFLRDGRRRNTLALARRNSRYLSEEEEEDSLQSRLKRLDHVISSQEISISRTLSTGSSVLDQASSVFFGKLSGLSPEKFAHKVEDLFRSIDVDGSNSLSRSELHSAFARMGHAMSGESLDEWIASCDSDGSGELDMEEFRHIACKVNKYRCPATCLVCKRSPEKPAMDDAKAAEDKKRLNYAQMLKEAIEPVCNLAAIYIKAQETDFDFKPLEPLMEIVSFSDGNRIAKSGSLTESIIFVLRGRVEKRKNNVKLSMHSRGDHFGSLEVLEHRPRPHDLIACGECTCAQLKQSHVKRAGMVLKELVEQLERSMLERKQEGEGLSHVSQASNAGTSESQKKEEPTAAVESPTSKRIKEVLSQVGSLLTRVPSLKETNVALFGSLSGLSGKEFSSKLKEIYDILDTDKSGKIDRSEIKDAFWKMGKDVSDETLDDFIEQTDVDGDEEIDLEEFEHLARALYDLDCVENCKVCRLFPTLQREKKAKMKSMIETSNLRTFSTTLMDGWALQDQLKEMIDDGFTRRYSASEQAPAIFSTFEAGPQLSTAASTSSNSLEQKEHMTTASAEMKPAPPTEPKLESRRDRYQRMADELKLEASRMHNRRRNSELHHLELRSKIDRDINLAKSYEREGEGGTVRSQAQQTANELLEEFEKAKRLGFIKET